MPKQKDTFEDIKDVIRVNLIDVFSQVILMYYHNYKKDEDSLVQIFSSLLDFVIMTENDSKMLYEDVICKLKNKYFYEIEEYEPLKIKSTL